MKKTLSLSLFTLLSLQAAEVQLSNISVEATQLSEVSQKANISADVADVLFKSVPSIDISRRSAIANDVFIRSQKRDNISVNVDGTKVYGACPNRMDPPVSHILANQIQSIEVIEGPYDVQNYGTLSGGLTIKTKKPSKEKQGSLNLAFGAFNYKKIGATLSGGNEKIRLLLTTSTESSNQYRDGNGNTLTEQTTLRAPKQNQYKPQYNTLQAYTKKSLNSKIFIKTAKKQELQLSYTANRSTDILYANGPMDASYDNSDIYSVAYDIKDLSKEYKNLNLAYYYSFVDHPMTTKYRNASNMAKMDITNAMYSSMEGIKLKNNFDLGAYKLLFGLDASKRQWWGEYRTTTSGAYRADSISDTITTNSALFTKLEKSFNALKMTFGARYDMTNIKNERVLNSREYTALSANIITTYTLNDENSLFFGVGQASRVPDARELYFLKGSSSVGTPTLNQTTNREVDVGYELEGEALELKVKLFYSQLQDYIYIQKAITKNAFHNINATLYGGEFSATYYIDDALSLDTSLSYKRGVKASPIAGQSDKDLADVAPLRGKMALSYEYKNNSLATLELQASDKWSAIDSDNGEQELAGWGIINMKLKHAVNKKFDFTIGVNNLLDATYATSNTYADLTLIVTGTSDAMLLNEPGRYLYTNLDFKF